MRPSLCSRIEAEAARAQKVVVPDLVVVVHGEPQDRGADSITEALIERTASMSRVIVGSFSDGTPDPTAPQADQLISNLITYGNRD